ncbi:hypothetical protein KAR48_11260 [bacterium]|nr:hypothetical protein [bacterium]
MLSVITGAIEVGKTTVLRRVLSHPGLQDLRFNGILTDTSPKGDKWISSLENGNRRLLARRHQQGDITLGRYGIRLAALDFANKCIQEADIDAFLIIDELGRLELNSSGFSAAFKAIHKYRNRHALIVVQQKFIDQYKNMLGPVSRIFTVTMKNRNLIDRQIVDHLSKCL